jgi:hypothetical protein
MSQIKQHLKHLEAPPKKKPIKTTVLKSKENEIIIFDILKNSQNDILKDNENHETIIQKITKNVQMFHCMYQSILIKFYKS